MKKREIVKSSIYFNDIIHNKKFHKNKFFVIYINKTLTENPKFGVAVGKKIGNAVIRNKLKRQIRVLIEKNKFLFPKHHDYIIIGREMCLTTTFANLNENFVKILKEKVNK